MKLLRRNINCFSLLLVTSRYLVVIIDNLVVTSGYLIATTGNFWLILVTFRYVWFIILGAMIQKQLPRGVLQKKYS